VFYLLNPLHAIFDCSSNFLAYFLLRVNDLIFMCSLKPNHVYEFRIAAHNDVGMSPFSLPSSPVTTLQATPDSPPIDLTARTVSPTSVVVSWMVTHA
jgi:hypothetical protein